MPRFFTQTISRESGSITGDDAKHIAKVLRMKIGEELTVCDTKGYDYHCMIESLSDKEVTLKVLSAEESQSEPSVKVHLISGNAQGGQAGTYHSKSGGAWCGQHHSCYDQTLCVKA